MGYQSRSGFGWGRSAATLRKTYRRKDVRRTWYVFTSLRFTQHGRSAAPASLVPQHRVNLVRQLRASLQPFEFDQHCDAGNLAAEFFDEVDACLHRAAGGEDV